MKLLYGVVGEGMGHAMRSRVVLEHLLAEGHEVAIMASQRAADYLAQRFPGVHRIHGLHIVVEHNRVRRGSTLWENVRDGRAALPEQIGAYFELIRGFRPQAVISDFESWTYLYGALHQLPVFSIDNMQIIHRCAHDEALIGEDEADFRITKAFIKGKLPHCAHYFITTFFYPPLRKERTSLVPPILRPEILALTPTRGEHLLVYQTSEGHEALVTALQRSGHECRIYGMRRGLQADVVDGNLVYRPFSEERFIADMAAAKAVVAGGGFTTMGECVYLKKPLLSVPIEGQFEQLLNGRYLEQLGYGACARTVDHEAIQAFLAAVPACEERLSHYHQDGNRALLAVLDEQLDRAAVGLA